MIFFNSKQICNYNSRLVLIAVLLAALWFGFGLGFLDSEGERAWETVRAGQRALWAARSALDPEPGEDRLRTGLIGVEWSPLTTTLGEIGAKRTSCNPIWAVRYLEWFDELGLVEGDPIAIYSSASFPGLLFSALVAAEARGLDVLLAVSLGSSMWGANRPEFPWPAMAKILRHGGYVRTDTEFYTPGGGGEVGRGFSREVMESFEALASDEGVPLVVAENLRDAVAYKTAAMMKKNPKLLISVGGSNANMGDSEIASDIPCGLIMPESANMDDMGDGVIAEALRGGIPVLHMLNVKKLALDGGIPWDPAAFVKARTASRKLPAFLGLAAFALVMATHRRWRLEGLGKNERRA